jgi:hypothetical protein
MMLEGVASFAFITMTASVPFWSVWYSSHCVTVTSRSKHFEA